MKWKVNEAKAKFSKLIQQGQSNPQIIVSRNKEVGVLISYEEFLEFLKYKAIVKKPSQAQFIDQLDEFRSKENDIIVSTRTNRKTWVD